MISVNNVKRACLAALGPDSSEDEELGAARILELVQFFQPPGFYLENNKRGFSTGARRTGRPRQFCHHFLLLYCRICNCSHLL
jgi:hypothetical protein